MLVVYIFTQNECVEYNLSRLREGRPFFRYPPPLTRGGRGTLCTQRTQAPPQGAGLTSYRQRAQQPNNRQIFCGISSFPSFCRINPNPPHESLQKLKAFLHFRHLNSVKWKLYRVHRAIKECLAKSPSFERLPGSHAVNRDVNFFRPVIVIFGSVPQSAVGSLLQKEHRKHGFIAILQPDPAQFLLPSRRRFF